MLQSLKNHNHITCNSLDIVQTSFFTILDYFSLLPHLWPKKSKFFKQRKNTWRYYCFALVHQKSQSYNLSSLHRVRTSFFVILGYFLPFYPICGPKNQIFLKNEKKTMRYYGFTYVYQKSEPYHVRFMRHIS